MKCGNASVSDEWNRFQIQKFSGSVHKLSFIGTKMEKQPSKKIINFIPYEKFIWTVKKLSKSKKLSSKVFKIGGYPWQILLSPKGVGHVDDHLSLYLKLEDSVISPYRPISFYAYFRLTLINQIDSNKSIVKDAQKQFSPRNSGWGSQCFMPLSDFFDTSKGYLVNDKCIIEAEIFISKVGPLDDVQPQEIETPKKKDQEQEHSSVRTSAPIFEQSHVDHQPIDDDHNWPGYPSLSEELKELPPIFVGGYKNFNSLSQREKPSAPFLDDGIYSSLSFEQVDFDSSSGSSSFKEMPSTPINELIDFKGLCQVERAFVPLLEEVCAWYPSLIKSQQKRSPKFVEWAFTALGRVLHFLKTTKGKEITEEMCEQLQVLWEELETFKFDLTWLEPHVESALSTMAYLERFGQVKELRDKVVSLEMHVKRLKAKVASVEVDLEVARRDLEKGEEGFEERDLETELGYGKP
ncbi:Ubiquitin carboxyl-terminal hydrolase family protein [Quillaja saponaria]|uniref:Ubiquitin carboxyl-terminal hydrolase family protein n=1 Tax=Quillaja saponaria TaxID=32244 RepID=A0AAD7Q6U1_QUISA|nr:Ubiquitin carboxyl-terminal hydrolase family protein [Quillaja saponaria]KAJ7975934.1 Ubiquitin carboxyl-terminal hydrolase family protein [Quillaja saponaria]